MQRTHDFPHRRALESHWGCQESFSSGEGSLRPPWFQQPLTESPGSCLLSQPGPELLYSVSLTFLEHQQPVLLRTAYLTLIRAAVKHSPPSFVFHYPQGRKISYEHHFTPTSQTRWDSAIPEAAELVSAQPWASCYPSLGLRFTIFATRDWKWFTEYSILSISVILWSIRVTESIYMAILGLPASDHLVPSIDWAFLLHIWVLHSQALIASAFLDCYLKLSSVGLNIPFCFISCPCHSAPLLPLSRGSQQGFLAQPWFYKPCPLHLE